MKPADALREEITFLEDEIRGLRNRMAKQDNAAQVQKLAMLSRLLSRCTRALESQLTKEVLT
ncbi:MAG: hypothetical protein BGO05_18570 [Rhizobiales bacterium 63-7]|nr:hypothetical protein [Hyphomicrobiales bacterium]OJU65893.1 MAG: hypothetical protein BGO05_18570 [Rhizobiales bacterium 63-7]